MATQTLSAPARLTRLLGQSGIGVELSLSRPDGVPLSAEELEGVRELIDGMDQLDERRDDVVRLALAAVGPGGVHRRSLRGEG